MIVHHALATVELEPLMAARQVERLPRAAPHAHHRSVRDLACCLEVLDDAHLVRVRVRVRVRVIRVRVKVRVRLRVRVRGKGRVRVGLGFASRFSTKRTGKLPRCPGLSTHSVRRADARSPKGAWMRLG